VLGRVAGGGVEAPASGGWLARAGRPGEREQPWAERARARAGERRAAGGGGGGRAGAGKSNDPQRPLGRFITVDLFAEGLDPGPSAKSFLFVLLISLPRAWPRALGKDYF
jgi:hypothetical protein